MGIDMTSLSKGDSVIEENKVLRTDPEDVVVYDFNAGDSLGEVIEAEGYELTVRPCYISVKGDVATPSAVLGIIVEALGPDGILFYHIFDVEQIRMVVDYVDDENKKAGIDR